MSSPQSRTWLLGYLRGSASGYRRGTVSLRRVTSSVLLATSHGVSDDDVSLVLSPHALGWEADRGAVIDATCARLPVPSAAPRGPTRARVNRRLKEQPATLEIADTVDESRRGR